MEAHIDLSELRSRSISTKEIKYTEPTYIFPTYNFHLMESWGHVEAICGSKAIPRTTLGTLLCSVANEDYLTLATPVCCETLVKSIHARLGLTPKNIPVVARVLGQLTR